MENYGTNLFCRFDEMLPAANAACQKSGTARDFAFYPDKQKGPGVLVNGQESCPFTRTAGHRQDQTSPLVEEVIRVKAVSAGRFFLP